MDPEWVGVGVGPLVAVYTLLSIVYVVYRLMMAYNFEQR